MMILEYSNKDLNETINPEHSFKLFLILLIKKTLKQAKILTEYSRDAVVILTEYNAVVILTEYSRDTVVILTEYSFPTIWLSFLVTLFVGSEDRIVS